MKRKLLNALMAIVMVAGICTPTASAMGDYSGNLTGTTWYWPIHGYSSTSSAFGKITSSYGYRGHNGSEVYNRNHYGVDIGEAKGTAVYAVRAGTVETAVTSLSSSAGRHVVVNHQDGYYSVYMHLSSVNVSKGQSVDENTLIGKVGGSGTSETSYANHLHLGIHYGTSYSRECNVNPCPSGYTRVGASFKESNGGYPVGDASITYSFATPPTTETILTFSDLTTPGTLTVGSVGHIDGRITSSNSPITAVKAEVVEVASGKSMINSSSSGFSVQSYGPLKSSKVDNNLKFGTLPVGTYYIKYTATTENGTTGTGETVTFQVIPVVHTHDKGQYMYYGKSHPHYNYYRCSVCGEVWADTSSSNAVDSCEICNPPQVASTISTIYLDACGGWGVTSSIDRDYGDYWDLPTPVRTGYTFGGWYSEKDGNGSNYSNEAKYWGKNEIKTIYAHWISNTPVHTHILTHIAAKVATESTEGNIEYWYCPSCGKYFSDGSAINEIDEQEISIPRVGHTLVYIDHQDATCTENGHPGYWHCEVCGRNFYSSSTREEVEIVGSVPTIPMLGHEFADGYCTRCGEPDPDYVEPEPALDRDDPHFPKVTIYFQGQFTDVPANQWFTQNVSEAFELGLMKGNTGDTFNPYGDVTLAEAITMAARIHAIYTDGYESFAQSGTWYQVYLDYAYQNGIINRAYYNANVTRKATRAQFAEIFANALPDKALYPINSISDGTIPDVSMSEAYASYTYKLYRAGVLTGGDAKYLLSRHLHHPG